jgi:very-short-patch-repair endonuclease
MIRQCIHCQTGFRVSVPSDPKRYCSQSCSASATNRGKKKSPEVRSKISKRLKSLIADGVLARPCTKKGRIKKAKQTWIRCCFNCGLLHVRRAKYCCSLCQRRAQSRWWSKNRSHVRGRGQPSYMEESFTLWLETRGLKRGLSGYLEEVCFYNPATQRRGWCDFVFPRLRLIIELDGTHHLARRELDQKRDAWLNARGWEVLRISISEYVKGTRKAEIEERLTRLESWRAG